MYGNSQNYRLSTHIFPQNARYQKRKKILNSHSIRKKISNRDSIKKETNGTSFQKKKKEQITRWLSSLISIGTTARRSPSLIVLLLLNDVDTIRSLNRLVVLYQVKYKRNRPTITIDRKLILLLFRLAYRADGMYRVNTLLSSIVSLILQSGSVYNDEFVLSLLFRSAYQVHDDNDDTITIPQIVILYQDVHEHDDIIYLRSRTKSSMANAMLKIMHSTYDKLIMSVTYNKMIFSFWIAQNDVNTNATMQ